MAIETEINWKYTKGADAKTAARNAKNAKTVGNATTSRGTLITKSNTEFSKDSFLKILAAQLSHLDPTQDQDSSAYVAQMAQFASLEQMQNLNSTMTDSSYQQMVGKTVILDQKDSSNNYVEGTVTGVIKKSGVTYLDMDVNGKSVEVDVKNVIGAVSTTDAISNANTSANSRAALNSDFIAASAMAADKKNVILAETDKDGKTVLVKGKVSGAYIDTVSSATVKIKVDVTEDGKTTTKIYDYGDIVKAGDLTDEEMTTAMTEMQATIDKAAADKVAADKAAADKATNKTTDTTETHIDYPYPEVVTTT